MINYLIDINRHILTIWQSISVLIGAFAIFALVKKNIISIDLSSSIMVLLSAWLISHLFDAAYWYNRNLTMIENIERQFLLKEDLKNIHYYFGEKIHMFKYRTKKIEKSNSLLRSILRSTCG